MKLPLISLLLILMTVSVAATYQEQVQFNFEKLLEYNCKSQASNSIKNISYNIKCGNSFESKLFAKTDYDSINRNGIRTESKLINKLIENGVHEVSKKVNEIERVNRNTSIQLNSRSTMLSNDISENNFDCQKSYNINKELLEGIRFEYKCHNNSPKINDKILREKFTRKIVEEPIKVDKIILFDTNFVSDENVLVEFNGSIYNSSDLSNKKIEPVIIEKVKSDTKTRKTRNLIEALHNDFLKFFFEKEESNWYLVGKENYSILIKNMTADLYDIHNAYLDSNRQMVLDTGLYLASHNVNTYITNCNNRITLPKPLRVICID